MAPEIAEAQVELRRDRAAGLADLEAVRPPARVDRRARGAHRGADHLGQLLEDDEVLRALQPAAARDHDLGLGQLGQPGRRLLAPLDELHALGGRSSICGLLHLGGRRPPAARPAGRRWAAASPSTASSPTSSSRAACPRTPGASPRACRPRAASAMESADEPRAEPRGQPRHQLALPRRHRRRGSPAATPCPRARRAPGVHTSPRYGANAAFSSSQTRLAPQLAELLQAPRAWPCRSATPPRPGCPSAGEPRGLAQHLGHDLLRIALPIVLDDAPERACHGFGSPVLLRSLWRLRAASGRAP